MVDMTKKSRAYIGVVYPDSESYNCTDVLIKLESFFESFAYITHDKDVDSNGELLKPHIHWVGYCRNARLLSAVSNCTGLPENSIEFCKSLKASIRYLVHADNKDKFAYDKKDIQGTFEIDNFFDKMDSQQMAQMIFDFIWSDDCQRESDFVRFAMRNGLYSEIRKSYTIFRAMLNEKKEDMYYGRQAEWEE